jgi:hypothetical protein
MGGAPSTTHNMNHLPGSRSSSSPENSPLKGGSGRNGIAGSGSFCCDAGCGSAGTDWTFIAEAAKSGKKKNANAHAKSILMRNSPAKRLSCFMLKIN